MVDIPLSIIASAAIAAFFFMIERLVQSQKEVSSSIDNLNHDVTTELSSISNDIEETKSEVRRANKLLSRIDARSDGGGGIQPKDTSVRDIEGERYVGEGVDPDRPSESKTIDIAGRTFLVYVHSPRGDGAQITVGTIPTEDADKLWYDDVTLKATNALASRLEERGYSASVRPEPSGLILFGVDEEELDELLDIAVNELDSILNQILSEGEQ